MAWIFFSFLYAHIAGVLCFARYPFDFFSQSVSIHILALEYSFTFDTSKQVSEDMNQKLCL